MNETKRKEKNRKTGFNFTSLGEQGSLELLYRVPALKQLRLPTEKIQPNKNVLSHGGSQVSFCGCSKPGKNPLAMKSRP